VRSIRTVQNTKCFQTALERIRSRESCSTERLSTANCRGTYL